jgi:hypothetical protein
MTLILRAGPANALFIDALEKCFAGEPDVLMLELLR